MKTIDDSESSDGAVTVLETGTEQKQPKKRGRPRGSRNKFSASAREEMAKHAPAVVRTVCRMAMGQPIYRRNADGTRSRLELTVDHIQAAQKMIMERTLAALKANELSGPDGGPIQTQHIDDTQALAQALLEAANDGAIDGAVVPAVEQTSTDNELGARTNGVAPSAAETIPPASAAPLAPVNGHTAEIGFAGHWSAPTNNVTTLAEHCGKDERPPEGMSATSGKAGKYQPGERVLVDETGVAIEFIMNDAAGNRSKWWLLGRDGMRVCAIWGREEAEAKARELASTGTIAK